MKNKFNCFLYWTPRILSLLFIAFFTLMSFDVISPGLSIWEIVIGLFMHNIPTFIMIIILIISWKYEIVGGIAFLILGLLYIVMVSRGGVPWYLALSWSLVISGPAFIIGILFLLNWFKKRQ